MIIYIRKVKMKKKRHLSHNGLSFVTQWRDLVSWG